MILSEAELKVSFVFTSHHHLEMITFHFKAMHNLEQIFEIKFVFLLPPSSYLPP